MNRTEMLLSRFLTQEARFCVLDINVKNKDFTLHFNEIFLEKSKLKIRNGVDVSIRGDVPHTGKAFIFNSYVWQCASAMAIWADRDHLEDAPNCIVLVRSFSYISDD